MFHLCEVGKASGVTARDFKISRQLLAHGGRGAEVEKQGTFRTGVTLQRAKHFLSYLLLNSPHLKDVSWGGKTLRLSTGEKLQTAQAYLLATRTRVIDAYYGFCGATQYTSQLSRRALSRIMEKLPLKKATALHGIDNTVASAKENLKQMQQILTTFHEHSIISVAQKSSLQISLKAIERHIQDDLLNSFSCESDCGDHCLNHALTDASSSHYRAGSCLHTDTPGEHTEMCEPCSLLPSVFAELDSILASEMAQNFTNQDLDNFRHEMDEAKSSLVEWKCHIARHANQSRARPEALKWVQERPGERATVHMDFIMKYLPTKYREANRDWYAKAGLNWHNSAVTITRLDGSLETTHFAHIFTTPIRQATESVTAISKHVLNTLKTKIPTLVEVSFSSDCAGTYLNANTLAGLKAMERETGVHVRRYDFSEPSAGKSVCDRAAGVQKGHVRNFVNQCNDVETAEQLVAALRSDGGVLNTTVALVDFQESKNANFSASITGIKMLRNFRFEHDGLTTWKAYTMGPGKRLPWSDIGRPVTGTLTVLSDFDYNSVKRRQARVAPTVLGAEQLGQTYDCEVEACCRTFSTHEQLHHHMELGNHHYSRSTSVPLTDLIRQQWVAEHGVQEAAKMRGWTEVKGDLQNFTLVQSSASWALQTTKAVMRKTTSVVEFLNKELANNDTRRVSIPDVSLKMRRCGQFDRSEWLSERQIKAWLGAMKSKQLQKKKGAEISDEDLQDANDVEQQREEEELTTAFEKAAKSALRLQHPVQACGKDLCYLSRSGALQKSGKDALKEFCQEMSLPYRKSSTKAVLRQQVTQHVGLCECINGGSSSDLLHRTAQANDPDANKTYAVEFEQMPFSEGVCKIAFHGHLVGKGTRNGEHVVVKTMKAEQFDTKRLWIPEQSVASKAKELSVKYNDQLSQAGFNERLEFCTPIVTKVSKSASAVVDEGQYVIVEKFLTGEFEKYNSNGGYEEASHPAVTAFSHWTFAHTDGDVMVCDLQGEQRLFFGCFKG